MGNSVLWEQTLVGNICTLPCPVHLFSSSQITAFSCCPLLFIPRASPSERWPYTHWPLNTWMLCCISSKEEEPCSHPRAIKDIISVKNMAAQLLTRKDLQEHVMPMLIFSPALRGTWKSHLTKGCECSHPKAVHAGSQRLAVSPSLSPKPSPAYLWPPGIF